MKDLTDHEKDFLDTTHIRERKKRLNDKIDFMMICALFYLYLQSNIAKTEIKTLAC